VYLSASIRFTEKTPKHNLQYFNAQGLIPLQSPFQCSNRFHCHYCYKGIKLSLLILYTGGKNVIEGFSQVCLKVFGYLFFLFIRFISSLQFIFSLMLEYSFFYYNRTTKISYYLKPTSTVNLLAALYKKVYLQHLGVHIVYRIILLHCK